MKFKIGETYKLKYSKTSVVRRLRTGEASQTDTKVITGNFELIRKQGTGYYLFENEQGLDLFMNKTDLTNAVEAVKV